MEPIALYQKADGELMLLHRCTVCGIIKANRVAGDDDLEVLRKLVPEIRQICS